jgi:hypothetical protein
LPDETGLVPNSATVLGCADTGGSTSADRCQETIASSACNQPGGSVAYAAGTIYWTHGIGIGTVQIRLVRSNGTECTSIYAVTITRQ